jgi:hypothetical protein
MSGENVKVIVYVDRDGDYFTARAAVGGVTATFPDFQTETQVSRSRKKAIGYALVEAAVMLERR